jgi:hypothetical protein
MVAIVVHGLQMQLLGQASNTALLKLLTRQLAHTLTWQTHGSLACIQSGHLLHAGRSTNIKGCNCYTLMYGTTWPHAHARASSFAKTTVLSTSFVKGLDPTQ